MRKYVFISIGGIFGAILRYLVRSIPIDNYHGNIPLNTLIINITGSFILAFVLTAANDVLKLNADLKLGIATGFIGAYTTFSTLCKEMVNLLTLGYYSEAVSYVTVSILFGIAGVYSGILLARKTVRSVKKDNRNAADKTFPKKGVK